jgi:hypothetical protein
LDQLHLDRDVEPETLRQTLARALGVEVAIVACEDDVDVRDGGGAAVVTHHGGEMATRIDVFVARVTCTREELARAIAAATGARVVHDGGSDNPYRAVLARADGTREEVDLDVEAMERDEVTLANGRWRRIEALREYWRDAPLGGPLETAAQVAAADALIRAVMERRPDRATLARVIEQARAAWTAEELKRSSNRALLEAAELLAHDA